MYVFKRKTLGVLCELLRLHECRARIYGVVGDCPGKQAEMLREFVGELPRHGLDETSQLLVSAQIYTELFLLTCLVAPLRPLRVIVAI